MNNVKTGRLNLFSGDDVVVKCDGEYCAGRVTADTKLTLTVRYRHRGGFFSFIFNRVSGYKRADYNKIWDSPRVFAPRQRLKDSNIEAWEKIPKQEETTL